MSDKARQQTGAALVFVLLGILVFVAIGAFIILTVDRNTDLRFAFQRSIIGFHSAEAGIHKGAVEVQNQMLNFQLPTNCGAGGTSFTINGRTVIYYLSVPTGPPYNGVAGSCAETPLTTTEAAGPYVGLNSLLYAYNLTSKAKNTLGFIEASINNQFQAHLIPMFQFAAFYANDLEFLPGPPAIINGRMHTNGDMYLNSESCGSAPTSGMNILGRITIVGSGISGSAPLNRGRKDDLTVNANNVYISTDGTTGGLQVLGTNAQGSMSCTQVATRQIPTSESSTFNNRITTGIQNISLPTPAGLLCVPWITGCGSTGTYFQNANLRIALDTTDQSFPTLNPGQNIYQIKVLNADGTTNVGATTSLQTFMSQRPGAITYSDVPATTSTWNCDTANGGNSLCETVSGTGYSQSAAYTTPFPPAVGVAGCTVARLPRDQITTANYCNDYRYGGFFNTREHKPILMLNIDWMALEEWNNANSDALFSHTVTTNNGLIVFFTIKDTTGTEALAADNYGIRIYDAGRARRNTSDPGVTFATDRAIYVAGNFNCPQPTLGGGSTPATCGDASWPPTPGSTYEKGASIVADTINVLSCNSVYAPSGGNPCGSFLMDNDQWTSANGCGDAGNVSRCRPLDEISTVSSGTVGSGITCAAGTGCAAANTVINAGFLASADQTWCSTNPNGRNCGTSYYNGGLENYPRFHENWAATGGFWYQGSFVESGQPSHTCFEYTAQIVAIGNDPNFGCGAYTFQGFWSTQRYSPPPRHWFYDVSFNNAALLPPLTPRFVYLSLVFFTQVYQ